MTPGLAGPPFPSKATKGAVVAVASLEKPSVPMVVGICEIDIASLQSVQGAKGHAVKGQHWAGDEIWAWSPSGKSGGDAPDQIDGWDVDEDAISAGVKGISVDDDEDDSVGGVAIYVNDEQNSQSEPHNQYVEGEEAEPYERVDIKEKELTTKGKTSSTRLGLKLNLEYIETLAKGIQRSTTSSGKPSSMQSTVIKPPTRAIQAMASASHCTNH